MIKYGIGYRNPPNHSKFKPGQSGNPKGRPYGRISTARLLAKHLDAKVTINVGAKKKRMSRREALILSIIGDAFKGNHKAKKQLLDLALSLDGQFHAESAHVVDTAQDRAVLDALLFSYGIKAGALWADDLNAPKENLKAQATKQKEGSK